MNMEKVFKKINGQTIVFVFALLTLAIVVLGLIGKTNNDVSIGADTVLPIAGTTYTLAGAGISSTATSFTLTSFTLSQTGTKITDSDMSETFYMTLEPGSRSRQEIVSCTTVTQNSDDTATISGCTRGLLPISPYTADTDYAFAHAGGSAVIVSDPPQLFNQTTFKDNDETITGSWSFPTPLGNSNAATKSYVDGLVTGGTVTNEALVVAGNAGETVATGTLVYFDGTDQEWKKVDTDTTSTYIDKFIGLTQGAGTDGTAITNGVLLSGRDTTQTGLTPGSSYYASAAAGEIGTSDTGVIIGEAEDTTTLYFDPSAVGAAYFGRDNTFTGVNVFNSTTTGAWDIEMVTFTESSTWTKDAGLVMVHVKAWGAGGGGGRGSGAGSGAGGGGGGYIEQWFMADDLNSTETVTIGTGGAGRTGSNGSGANGGNTTFGSKLTAYGGKGGGGDTSSATGGNGGDFGKSTTVWAGDGVIGADGSENGAYWGGGGGTGSSNQAGGDALFGGAGGSGGGSVANALFGTSVFGGDGGAKATAGTAPGGGGGGNYDANGAAGANGQLIVTEYY